jgi:hypothetical protein
MLLAMRHDLLGCDLGIGLQLHKGTSRLAPARIGLDQHGCSQQSGVTVQHVFHFDGRDVLAARNDDVLAAALDLM